MRAAAVIGLVLLGSSQPARAELTRDQIHKVVKAHLRDVVACFEKAPNLSDQKVVVTFTIAPSGTVTKAVGSGNPSVQGCVAGVIRTLRFPASPSSTEVKYPFNIDFAGN